MSRGEEAEEAERPKEARGPGGKLDTARRSRSDELSFSRISKKQKNILRI